MSPLFGLQTAAKKKGPVHFWTGPLLANSTSPPCPGRRLAGARPISRRYQALRRRRLIRPIAPMASRLSVPGSGTADPMIDGLTPTLGGEGAIVAPARRV